MRNQLDELRTIQLTCSSSFGRRKGLNVGHALCRGRSKHTSEHRAQTYRSHLRTNVTAPVLCIHIILKDSRTHAPTMLRVILLNANHSPQASNFVHSAAVLPRCWSTHEDLHHANIHQIISTIPTEPALLHNLTVLQT
jgi:hypothetical protein